MTCQWFQKLKEMGYDLSKDKFKTYIMVLSKDISKAYDTVCTGLKDKSKAKDYCVIDAKQRQ